MRITRVLLVATGLLMALVIESVWLSTLGLPGSVPPLTLVSVLALALMRTPPHAATIGFLVGLVADLVPPSGAPLGVSAFSFALMAFAISYWRNLLEGSTFLTLFAFASAAFAAFTLRILLALGVGANTDPVGQLFADVITAPLYAMMLASMVLPLNRGLDRITAGQRQLSIYR